MGYIILQLARFFETLILAVGTHLAISVGGIFFFGFSVTYLIGSYAVAIAAEAGIGISSSILIAIGFSLLGGLLCALMYRRLSNDGFAVFMVASVFAFDAVLKSWDSVTGGTLGIAGIVRPSFAPTLTSLMILEGVLAAVILLVEFVILKSPFGRALIAHKESPRLLNATGISAKKVGMIVIIFASVLSGISGIVGAWRIQFLDPTFGGVMYLVFGLTVAILAIKPKIQWIIGSSAFCLLLPEIIRFLPLPSSIFANVRSLIYAVLLIVLIRWLSDKHTDHKRLV